MPEAEYEATAAKIRSQSSFVRDIESEPGLGCFWKSGLVFQDSEGNFVEITKASGISKTRLHHLHFDTTDLDASVNFYRKFLNCTVEEQGNGYAAVTVPSGQCVVLNRVSELSEVTKTTYRGRHFAFNVTNDNFHAIVDKLHTAGIEERDDHGEREGRRPEQLGTYFREPSGFRLQITNENSAEFAAPRQRLASWPRNSQHKSIVIPGKLAIASATRNPAISTMSGCPKFTGHDGKGRMTYQPISGTEHS